MEEDSTGVLGEDDVLLSGETVSEALRSKHPDAQDEKTEAILLVDASNAFNSLNRATALRNIQTICPAFSIAQQL